MFSLGQKIAHLLLGSDLLPEAKKSFNFISGKFSPQIILTKKECFKAAFSYLEELVKEEGEPVGEHFLSHRLCPKVEKKENWK